MSSANIVMSSLGTRRFVDFFRNGTTPKQSMDGEDNTKTCWNRKNGVEERHSPVLNRLAHCTDIPLNIRDAMVQQPNTTVQRRKMWSASPNPTVQRRKMEVNTPQQHHLTLTTLENQGEMSDAVRNAIGEAKYAIDARTKSQDRRKALVWCAH